MSKYKIIKVDETPEEIIKRKNRQNRLLILIILLLILGFIIYEAKFAEKGIFNKGDRYEEYDPNYPIDSNNIEQSSKRETSNVVEVITSNITSNILITSNVVNSNSNKDNSNTIVSNSNKNNSNTIVSNNNSSNNNTSNGSKDTTKPVISGASYSVGINSITVNVICSDNITARDKLKKEYSIDNKNWTTSNTFNNLKGNTTYTIYIRVTDEAGNVSNTYSKQQKTLVLKAMSDVTGVYIYNNNRLYVLQLTNNKIVYKVGPNGTYSIKYLDSSKTTTEKKYFDSWYFDNKNLHAGTITYYKSNESSVTKDEVFKKLYNTTGTFDNSFKVKCNGLWTISSRSKKMHMIAYTNPKYNDYDCDIKFENTVGVTDWYTTEYDNEENKINSSKIIGEYNYNSTYGYVWKIRVPLLDNGTSAFDNAGGDVYQKSKSYSIEDAIELKLTGKIS